MEGIVLEPYNWLLCFHYANRRWSSEGVCVSRPCVALLGFRRPQISDLESDERIS